MGTKGRTSYRIAEQNAIHYLTIATVEWVDIFTKKLYKEILVDSFQYCIEQKGLVLYSYVIMSNHVHFIAKAKEGFHLSDILRDFKRHTAKQILVSIKSENESRKDWLLEVLKEAGSNNKKNKTYQVWRQDNHPIELYSNEVMEQKLDYIHNNPVEECIVQYPEEYMYSSAGFYAGKPSLLVLTRLE